MTRNARFLHYLMISASMLFLQDLWANDIALKHVVFYPPTAADGWVSITPDEVEFGPVATKSVEVKAWDGSGTSASLPVAYVSGYKPRLYAKFVYATEKCPPKKIFVKAETADKKFTLPIKPITENCEYPISEANEEFLKYQVRVFPGFTLNWYYSSTPDDDASWVLAGKSKNEMYVLHQKPFRGVVGEFEEPTSFYYTCIYNSCVSANGMGRTNDGKNNPDAVVDRIFELFRNKCVKKKGGTQCMKYWGEGISGANDPQCRNIFGLFDYENAQCGEWCALFLDMLKLHGIVTVKKLIATYQLEEPSNLRGYLNPATEGLAITAAKAFFGNATYDNGTVQYRKNPNGKISSYFFVKNYDFDIGLPPNIPSSAPFFNTQTISNNINIPLPIVVTPNNLTITPADLEGVGGQGVNNPKSSFDNHVILSYKQQNGELVYFDPSYGKPNAGAYGSTSVYESDNIAGYGAALEYNLPNGVIFMIWLHEKEDLSKTQLTIK